MKVVTEEQLAISTEAAKNSLNKLRTQTKKSDANDIKRSDNYMQWIQKKTDIIAKEPTFSCPNEDKLVRGAVVWIEFGFNIGNEFGGRHPAIILRKTGQSIFVVPLSSQTPSPVKQYHVKIEKVYGFSSMTRWTNVLKLQNVSIQRVDMAASLGNVKGDVLNDINEALKKCHIF